jgi:hypothetical protein
MIASIPSGNRRRPRRGASWMLALALAVGPALASGPPAWADPSPPLPTPVVPAPPLPQLSATATVSTSTAPPCTSQDCIPHPSGSAPALPEGPTNGAVSGEATDTICAITSIGGCITTAINDFFRGLVTVALNPLLDLLSTSLLSTPSPESLPRVGELWNQSWQILLACYGLLVMAAGVLIMAHESLQAQYSIKEIASRLVVGFLAGALNLFLATKAIAVANALVTAVMGGGLDAGSAGETMKNMILTPLSGGGIFITFLGVFLTVAVIVLLITYIVRVAITIILVAGGPLAMMCHGLPQTEPVAFWWWKAFGGCLAIQIAQSLALITGVRVFLAPGGFTPFGATRSGLVNLLVTLALLYILIKIPFWILGSLRGGGHRSLVGTLARTYVIGKTLTLFRR